MSKVLKNFKNSRFFGLFFLLISVQIDAMNVGPRGTMPTKKFIEVWQKGAASFKTKGINPFAPFACKSDEFFIHQEGSPLGVCISSDVLKLSKTLTNMVGMVVGTENVEQKIIPLPFPITVIKNTFAILKKISKISVSPKAINALIKNKITITNYSIDQLIPIVNCITFLDCPDLDIENNFLPVIKEYIDKNDQEIIKNKEFTQLNPDLQKSLMLDPTINYLKDCIIKKYAQERKQSLTGHPGDVRAVAFSPDGTKIVSGGYSSNQNNLILWDISDTHNITHQPLTGHPDSVNSVAFSPDSTRIVSGGRGGNQNNLILWDISDTHNITHQPLTGHPVSVFSVACSPDGTKIVSGGRGNQNNLILWDISDTHNITHQLLTGHPDSVNSVAFSPDSTRIVSGIYGGQNTLILWDISNPHAITRQNLADQVSVFSVACSPDGTKIVSGGVSAQNTLILWDISNPHAITHQNLADKTCVFVVACSPDGTKIVSGGMGNQNNLILWDISNPHAITHQNLAGHPNNVDAVAFSPDGTKIVSGGQGNQNNLILWTLFTNQEVAILNSLKNCTIDQIQLIYQLYLNSSRGLGVELKQGTLEWNIFSTLPQDMQTLLTDLLPPKKSWWSSWLSW